MSTGAEELRARIARARDNFEQLRLAFTKSTPTDSDTVLVEHKPERQSHQITVGRLAEPRLDWRTITGDVIHQLRATLDNAVCHMAIKAGHSTTACEKTEFPIFPVNSDDAKRALKNKVAKFVHPDALAAIEDLQPYKRPEPLRDPLWTIHRLDILDKHRMLVIVGKRVRVPFVVVTDGKRTERVEITTARWHIARPGAKLVEFTVPDAHAEVKVKPEPELEIVFDETGTDADDKRVLPMLNKWIDLIDGIVSDFETKGLI